jgi:hypothetical protein
MYNQLLPVAQGALMGFVDLLLLSLNPTIRISFFSTSWQRGMRMPMLEPLSSRVPSKHVLDIKPCTSFMARFKKSKYLPALSFSGISAN